MALTPVLRVVEIAAHGADADIPAALGLHLRLLHVADAVFRVKRRRCACPARRRSPPAPPLPVSPLVAVSTAISSRAPALSREGGHQARQKRERHVLEGAGGAAEEFEHVGVADLDKAASVRPSRIFRA